MRNSFCFPGFLNRYEVSRSEVVGILESIIVYYDARSLSVCVSAVQQTKNRLTHLYLWQCRSACPEVLRSALLGPLSAVSRSSSLTVRSNTGPIGCSDSAGELRKCHCKRLSFYLMIKRIKENP